MGFEKLSGADRFSNRLDPKSIAAYVHEFVDEFEPTTDRRRPHKHPSRPLVLFVDDNADNRDMYVLSLTELGFEAIAVNDSSEAYVRAWQLHPDVIVTEYSLRDQDGLNLLGQIKNNARTRDIRVVMLSAHVNASRDQQARRDGCSTVIVTPCLPDRLAIELWNALHERPAIIQHAAMSKIP